MSSGIIPPFNWSLTNSSWLLSPVILKIPSSCKQIFITFNSTIARAYTWKAHLKGEEHPATDNLQPTQNGGECNDIINDNKEYREDARDSMYLQASLSIETPLHQNKYRWHTVASRVVWELHGFRGNTKDWCTAYANESRIRESKTTMHSTRSHIIKVGGLYTMFTKEKTKTFILMIDIEDLQSTILLFPPNSYMACLPTSLPHTQSTHSAAYTCIYHLSTFSFSYISWDYFLYHIFCSF